MSGSLIRLFSVDGNPKGLRTVEISNTTIYATIFPRTKLKDFLNRNESQKPGCYILLGENIDNPDKMTAYVGEGESVDERLKSHSHGEKQKDFGMKRLSSLQKMIILLKLKFNILSLKYIN